MNPEIARRPVAERLREWLIARCLAPINLDGSQVSEVTIDGDSVSEVTMDGEQVFGGAIPDSEDLQARYDATALSATDGSDISTWPDETANGFDLTAGTAPSYQTSVINGNPVVRFDGSSTYLDVDFGETINQPNTVFIVFVKRATNDGVKEVYSGFNERHGFADQNSANNDVWILDAADGQQLESTTSADTNNHIASGLFNGANSEIRLDGTSIATGDAGGNSATGLTVGCRFDQNLFANYDVGEILWYPQDKSGIYLDVETFLSDKWGIAI